MLQNNTSSCAILKGSPSETRGVNKKYMNNKGFVCIKVDKLGR